MANTNVFLATISCRRMCGAYFVGLDIRWRA